jgi:hypothetical protein
VGTYRCAVCDAEFISYNVTPTYCSRRCKGEAQAASIDIERLRLLYESGMSQSEVAKELGVSQKSVHKAMRRHAITPRPRIKRDQTGERNDSWKGNAATYAALHYRVKAVYGKPQRCQRCGSADDPAKVYEWANLTGNYYDVNDYERMCRSCHRLFDASRRQEVMPNDAQDVDHARHV